jgi:alkanesulfonate monooxygenase SsuD/methylene tetrahydromethanopterin reductase-like flavin-dependent oxidoreductase (luciferase family)
MRLLMAVRIGETWPPQLARQIATIDHMLGGRLTINIISSDMPGATLASAPRYARTVEAMRILKTLLNGEPLDHDGEFWRLKLDPPRIGTVSGRAPLLYFGGLSEDAREAAAKGCDVFLMWPDKKEAVAAIIADMTTRAARYGRTLRYGYRAHVIVRESETEARAAADRLLSKLDAGIGAAIRAKSLDSTSVGVKAQAIPTRFWRNSTTTERWGSKPSFSPATLMRRRRICSHGMSCRTSTMARSSPDVCVIGGQERAQPAGLPFCLSLSYAQVGSTVRNFPRWSVCHRDR